MDLMTSLIAGAALVFIAAMASVLIAGLSLLVLAVLTGDPPPYASPLPPPPRPKPEKPPGEPCGPRGLDGRQLCVAHFACERLLCHRPKARD